MARTLVCLLAVLLGLGLSAPARAQTTLTTDTTITATLLGNVEVVGSAVLAIASGGSITGDVTARQNSTVNLQSGGSVGGLLTSYDSSTVNLSGGSIGDWAEAHDNSIVNVLDGSITAVHAYGSSTVNVSSGSTSLNAHASSTVNVSGGSIGFLLAEDSSTTHISGGSANSVSAIGSSGVDVSGGSIAAGVSARGSSAVNLSGGSFGNLSAASSSTINLSGGSVSGSLETLDFGQMHVFGCVRFVNGAVTGTLLDRSPIQSSVNGVNVVLHGDISAPAIVCPASLTVTATSAAGATVNYSLPSATDNCPGPISVQSSPPSGSTFPVGTTQVVCTATDASGQQSACSFTVTVLPIADLALSMTASETRVRSGKGLAYTLRVRNNGPHSTQGVVINGPVPAGTVFDSATPGPSTAPAVGSGGTASWYLGALNSGAEVNLTLVVKITAKGQVTISNTAAANSATTDPNPANNSATVQTRIGGK